MAIALPAGAAPATKPSPSLPATELAQSYPDDPVHLFLMPVSSTSIRLLTHIVEATVNLDGDQPVFSVQATYRLHNPTRESVTLSVQVAPAEAQISRPRATGVTLTLDGQSLPLQEVEGASPTTQITMAADARRMAVLSYQIRLAESDLPAFSYPTQPPAIWAGAVESWRVTLTLPGEQTRLLPAESWVNTTPEGWTYNGSQLQWLSEGDLPGQAIVLQFIHPRLWRELTTTRLTIGVQPSIAQFVQLGNLYNRLYRSPQVPESSRERFYAQALAAYADGIAYGRQLGIAAAELGPLHRALTALYRSRSVKADGAIDFAYVDLMVAEAQKAVAADPGQGNEAAQWLAEGLRLQLRRAQQVDDWQMSFSVLDQLAALPPGLIDAAWLDAERQMVQLQQALALIEQDNEEAAMVLAGVDIADESLLPPPQSRLLYASWQVTLTIQPDTSQLHLTARPHQGREEIARRTFEQLQQAWQAVGAPGLEMESGADGISIRLHGNTLAKRTELAQRIPPVADWALLRNLLVNPEPYRNRSYRLIWQEVELSQRLDLRPVADQWRGIAAQLDRQMAQIANTPAPAQASTIDATQAQMSEQLRRIYLRQETAAWQSLVQSSVVRVQMTAGDANGRQWIVQLSDPPQTLTFHTETLSRARLLLAIVGLLIFILTLASVLWLLL